MVPFDGEQAVTPDVQERARRVMEARAREMGVTSVAVRSEEPDLLIVELRGKDSAEETRHALSRNGFLEIIETGDTPLQDGTIVVTSEGGPTFQEGEPQSLNPYRAIVTSREILPDKVSYKTSETTGQPEVALALNDEGTRKFLDFTSANIGKYAPVVLDKQVLSSPQIQGAFPTVELVITGLSDVQARQVVAVLKAGVMPTKLELSETQQLGTSTNP
jgi:preprotein translocase subunit SecD